MLPRVLIVYTGGTFGMELTRRTQKGAEFMSVPDISPQTLKKKFLLRVPELQNLARCDVEILLNRDSAHIGPPEWLLIAKTIREKWKAYDGIVLLHGTDTLAYTASALSFLLRPCLKPVVMTGAQRPLSALRTDARMNLISAVEIAAHGPRSLVNQVSVIFGDKLFQGNRVRKKSAADFAAFESPHVPILAVVGSTIRYSGSSIAKPARLALKPKFSERVMAVHVTPGFPSQAFEEGLLKQLDALLMIVFPSGTAPTHDPGFLHLIGSAKKLKIPIVIATETTTQPPSFSSSPPIYAAGSRLKENGCFWAGALTPECAYVKTKLILGQTRDLNKFEKLWHCDLAGEGTVS